MESRASDMHRLIRCINFSAIKHKDQRRLDSARTPYINHPVGVAAILTEEGGVTDQDVIMAAILHDTVEDTDTTIEEIESEFGRKIASIVAEVTDDKKLPKQERKRLQVCRFVFSILSAAYPLQLWYLWISLSPIIFQELIPFYFDIGHLSTG